MIIKPWELNRVMGFVWLDSQKSGLSDPDFCWLVRRIEQAEMYQIIQQVP